ncbi:tetratricopeptide repeat protein [Micromonospora sp. B11E3]|uniref:tetratricopeptide repeat protein n=1 Tax=Micromonospora sp. B11E3 TaxID=3153562 RepID=UPI00325DB037
MPSGFGELTVQATHLVSAGDLAGAQQLLSDALSDADSRPDRATPELAEAAGLQARVLVALGEPHSARGWAAFAYAAATRLHGRSDPRTVTAAATLAAVLHRVGSYARAARLYADVIIELTASDGPESPRVLAAHADLATVEYARGQCEVARERLQDAWELHREVYGDGHPSGIKMLARLGSMQRDCGEFAEAHDNLALARELCRQHLAADDPLAVQVAALARAAANPAHVCAQPGAHVDQHLHPGHQFGGATEAEAPAVPPDREPPVVPAARMPPPAEGPPAYQPTWPADDDPHPPGVPTPRLPPEAPARHAAPAEDDEWPPHAAPDDPAAGQDDEDTWQRHAGPASDDPARVEDDEWPRHAAPSAEDPVPDQDEDAWLRRHAAPDGPARVEDEDAWLRRHAVPDGPDAADEGRWVPRSGWPPEGAVPPAVVGLAGGNGQPADGERPGAGPAGGGAEPAGVRAVRPPAAPPEPSRLLPVLVPRPPAPPPRRLAPLVLVGGVTVVVLGTAAVVAGVSRVDSPRPGPSPSATAPPGPARSGSTAGAGPSGSPQAAASPGTPPGGITLRDNRDNIALSWTYPAGASGPVVIAGSPSGQQPRAFETLPPGSTSYLVHGLDRDDDYCFTVAVVWSVDKVGQTGQVCTRRH